MSLDVARAKAERTAVLAALRAVRGHRARAAEHLGVSRSTLERRLTALWTAAEIDALTAEEGWPDRGGRPRGDAAAQSTNSTPTQLRQT